MEQQSTIAWIFRYIVARWFNMARREIHKLIHLIPQIINRSRAFKKRNEMNVKCEEKYEKNQAQASTVFSLQQEIRAEKIPVYKRNILKIIIADRAIICSS